MTEKLNVHIVSHTHWDREWYLPKENFKLMLVELIDRLLYILDNDESFAAFMLDGQTIALEDYFDIKPENEQRLKQWIEKGRILIGPWYVLPDEILISGEAHIRNYMIGDELCSKYGKKMNVGYLPDSFGHPSQMPQIIKGLGMDELIFWRGLGAEIDKVRFMWSGPDGSEIYAINMPFGYGIAACLPQEKDHFIQRIRSELNKLSPFLDGTDVLMMNGSDHLAPQPSITRLIRECQPELEDCTLLHTTLPAYISAVKEKGGYLQSCSGELRSAKRAYLLGGTISTRMYIKYANYYAERLLEKWCEPMSALSWIFGGTYPSGELRQLWKYQLSNLPHDSICGCSVDEVHREMMGRYDNIQQLGNCLLDKALEHIAGKMDPGEGDYDGFTVVFNPLGNTRRYDVVRTTIDVEPQLLRRVDFDLGKLVEYEIDKERSLPSGIQIHDSRGNEVPCTLDHAEKTVTMKLSLDNQPEMYEVIRLNISFMAKDVPSLGFDTYYYRLNYGKEQVPESHKDDFRLENEYLVVVPNPVDGTLDIYDKNTDKTYKGCNNFIDGGDAGDEYTYSFPANNSFVSLDKNSVKLEWVENSPVRQSISVRGVMRLPVGITEDRTMRDSEVTECPITSVISVYPGIKRVDIETEFDNNARDHRLRVHFPTWILSDVSFAESTFSVEKRKLSMHNESPDAINDPDYTDSFETPCLTHPQKTFVDVHDEEKGLAVTNQGITEFEVMKDGEQSTIALTLLRCVGWLSRPDLLTRKGNGGWTLPTPEAQCPGKQKFRYSILPHRGNWLEGQVLEKSHEYNVPLKTASRFGKVKRMSWKYSLLKVDLPEVRLSAVKKADKSDNLIVRFYNSSDHEVNTTVEVDRRVREAVICTLDEKPVMSAAFKDGKIELALKPWQIMTLSLAVSLGHNKI